MSEAITGSVAAEVRAEVARKNVPQRQVAAALGMSQASAWRRLRGEVPFDIAELVCIADFLGVPVAQFLPDPPPAEPKAPPKPPQPPKPKDRPPTKPPRRREATAGRAA